MGFSYTVYCGPALVVRLKDKDFIENSGDIQDAIDERLREARQAIDEYEPVYFIPNSSNCGHHLNPKYQDESPFSVNKESIEKDILAFESEYDDDISVIKRMVEDAVFSTEWIVLMDAI